MSTLKEVPPPDSLLDRAVVAARAGDQERAEDLLHEAAGKAPEAPRLHATKGFVLASAGHIDRAIAAYERALELDPGYAAARYDLALLLAERGRKLEALDMLEMLLELEPSLADAHRHRLLLLSDLERFEATLQAADTALRQFPGCVDFLVARATALRLCQNLDDALAAIDETLAASPEHAPALAEKGSILHAMGRYAEALDAFDRALETDESAFMLNGIGLVELDSGMAKAALAAFNRALELAPDNFDSLFYRAQALETLGRFDEALAAYAAILAKKPNSAHAYNNIGKIRRDMGLIAEAEAAFRQALALTPDDAKVHSNLLLTLLYDPTQSPEDLAKEHAAWGRRFGHPPDRFTAWPNEREPKRRLRIGFVSAELCRHAVSGWLLAALQALDRQQYEVTCYANRGIEDEVTGRFKPLADRWRLVVGMTDRHLAELVRQDGIDILIDISGHTALNRLQCFALKPAPVQATWLGYPFTTGLDAIDYAIMDEVAVPPGEERLFVERVARLSPSRFCYQPPAAAVEVATPSVLRNGWITFGSFNNVAKLTLDVLDLWCDLLHRLPTARLILKSPSLGDPSVAKRLRETFARSGITAGRLELRGGSDTVEVLRQYGDVDIALDPFPFGGGATSCEALWMGVPVITMPSWQPVSRQTETCLRAIGHQDWVARDPQDYLAIATHLARNPDRLAQWRAGQRQTFQSSAICDQVAFGEELGKALRAMWEQYCSHLARA